VMEFRASCDAEEPSNEHWELMLRMGRWMKHIETFVDTFKMWKGTRANANKSENLKMLSISKKRWDIYQIIS
jgi:hypothetical protein